MSTVITIPYAALLAPTFEQYEPWWREACRLARAIADDGGEVDGRDHGYDEVRTIHIVSRSEERVAALVDHVGVLLRGLP